MTGRIRRGAALAALVATSAALWMGAPTALAQSSSVNTYGGTGGNVVSKVDGPTADPPATSGSQTTGTLPFTGFDLALAALGGLLLLGAGVALSRAVESRPAAQRRGG